MRAKLTGPLAILVGAVAMLGSVRPAAAQNFPPGDRLTTRMPEDAVGVDVKAVLAIAMRLGVPVGFEEVGALADQIKGPFHPLLRHKPIVSVRPTPLDVRGVTLREALDAVVAKDPRYAWTVLDGVVVVRPVAAWRDPSHPLLRPMQAVRLEDARLAEAVDPWRLEAESDPAEGTLLDRLNATARARGQYHWILASSSALVLMDRGRAVEIVEPVLRLGDEAGEDTIPLYRR